MKKGFTLVELITVVVILGIILVIAVPRITDVINNAKINAVIKNEEMLIRATKNYLVSNNEKMPTEIGSTEEVTLEQLQTEELIQPIKSPFINDNCSGYVLITKIEDNSYDYTPHLNCVDPERGSASADGLVLHYKFNDFQEWTENLADSESKRILSLHSVTSYQHVGQGSSLAPEKGEGWYKFHISRRGTNFRIAQFPYIFQTDSFTRTYSIEFDFGETEGYYWRIDGFTGNAGTEISTDKWVSTRTNSSVQSGNLAIFLYNQAFNEDVDDVIFYRYYQVEDKTYPTPFVNGIREGKVTDYSIHNNVAILDENTPRWVANSIVGEGAYQFDGINYINLSSAYWQSVFNNVIDNNFTISAWIKPTVLSHSSIVGQRYGDSMVFGMRANGKLFLNMDDTRSNSPESNNSLSINEWQHITVSFENNGANSSANFFINGKMDGSGIAWDGNGIEPQSHLYIGWQSREESGFPGYFNGLIDDVRIYNRVLNKDEIKKLYESTK